MFLSLTIRDAVFLYNWMVASSCACKMVDGGLLPLRNGLMDCGNPQVYRVVSSLILEITFDYIFIYVFFEAVPKTMPKRLSRRIIDYRIHISMFQLSIILLLHMMFQSSLNSAVSSNIALTKILIYFGDFPTKTWPLSIGMFHCQSPGDKWFALICPICPSKTSIYTWFAHSKPSFVDGPSIQNFHL